jgi:hypothetical protein
MREQDDRLPTALWVDAHLHQLTLTGISFYIVQKGAHAAGTVLLKISNMGGECLLLQQQRDLDGNMGWMKVFDKAETAPESEADAYMRRAIERDPDLWVIEIEDKEMNNPFEGDAF